MPRKPKPVKDLKNVIDSKEIPKNIVKTIQAKCNIVFNDEDAAAFITASKRYLGDKDVINKGPRWSQQIAAVKEVKIFTKKLLGTLENMDFVTEQHLTSRFDYKTDDLLLLLRQLIVACDSELKSIPADVGGARTDYALDYYIEALGSIFKQVSDRLPTTNWNDYSASYQSKFLSFVSISLEQIDPTNFKYQTNNGLAQRIQKVYDLHLKDTPKTEG